MMHVDAAVIVLACGAVLLALGILERRNLNRNVKRLPLRINVNGIRGKSTVTRLIAAILEEAGYRVVGKTTGTSARMFVWNRAEEIEIKRRPVGPNIGEQVSVIQRAVSFGADALVCECMAVKPEYQEIYQHQIIQANLVVITNVVEDHLDEMGPTTDQIAQAFAGTIPEHGTLVITKGPYARYFRGEAARRDTRVICVDPEGVEDGYLRAFPYLAFKNNCALGLGVARALGIDEETARRAMLKARPDPGSTNVYRLSHGGQSCWMVNAFAANEPASSKAIWQEVQSMDIPARRSILILCCRDDRIDRTRQFVDDFLPFVRADRMLVIGTGTNAVLAAYRTRRFSHIDACVDLTGRKSAEIIAALEQGDGLAESLIFCAGNIHGEAEAFLEEFAAIRI